jgi:hypothetical protein
MEVARAAELHLSSRAASSAIAPRGRRGRSCTHRRCFTDLAGHRRMWNDGLREASAAGDGEIAPC